jgi:hypothetical protein
MMAEALSRMGSRKRSEPKTDEKPPEPVEDGKPEGDHMHQAAESMHKAEPHFRHMIMSHDGYGMKTHSIDEQGKHEGPHEDEEANAHMQRFMGGEQQHDGGEEPEENQSLY